MKTEAEVDDEAKRIEEYIKNNPDAKGSMAFKVLYERLTALYWVLEVKSKNDPTKIMVDSAMPDEKMLGLMSDVC